MAGYIGSIPVPQATQTREAFTATSNQTTFNTGGYTAGFIDVYMNGVKLAAADFTATNGSDVVLASGAAANDIVEVVAYTAFEVLNQNFTGTTTVDALTATGAISGTSADFDGGVTIDNITIDGAEIDLSAGDLLLDVAGDIILDAGGGDFIFKEAGTENGRIIARNTGEFVFYSAVSDEDITFKGNDGGSTVTALTLDMSDAGTAQFNHDVELVQSNYINWKHQAGGTIRANIYANSSDNLVFGTGSSGTERMRIDGSGNVGIGTTGPDVKLHVEGSLLVDAFDAGNEEGIFFREGFTASNKYNMSILAYDTDTSPDGMSINAYSGISFCTGSNTRNERMRISSAGNVHITDNSNGPDAALHIEKTTPQIRLQLNGNSGYNTIESGGTNELIIGRSGTEQLRINSAGHLGLGTSTPTDSAWGHNTYGNMEMTINGGGGYAVIHMTGDGAGSSSKTFSQGVGDGKFYMAYDKGEATHRIVVDNSGNVGIGTNSPSYLLSLSSASTTQAEIKTTATNGTAQLRFTNDAQTYVMGVDNNDTFFVFDTTGSLSRLDMTSTETVFNNNHSNIDFRVESDGNANMIFVDASADTVLFGKSAVGTTTTGAYFSEGSGGFFHEVITHSTTVSSYSPLYINRHASDGVLIQFRQADSNEGDISVSGSTVSFNGFSGRHESSGIPTNTPIGTVVSTIDELDVYPDTTTDTDGNTVAHKKAGQTRADHAKVEVSTSEGDVCVYGVVAEFNDDGKLIVTSVGIGSVRVTGACAKGDLLESNGDGTAKVQSDDIIRSKTIGKVTIGNSNTGVKLVSCVMYCG